MRVLFCGVRGSTTSIAYVPDHLSDPGPSSELARVLAGVDLLIHETGRAI